MIEDADAPEEDRSKLLELPDGTLVAALNDAVDAAPLSHTTERHSSRCQPRSRDQVW